MESIEFWINPSKTLTIFFALAFFTIIGILVYIEIPGFLKIILILYSYFQSKFIIELHGLKTHPRSIRWLCQERARDGQKRVLTHWRSATLSGQGRNGKLLGDSYSRPWLLIIHLRNKTGKTTFLVTPDCLRQQEFRALRLRLNSAQF